MNFLSLLRDAIGRSRIGYQLYSAFSIMIMLTALTGGVAIYSLGQAN